MQDDLKRLTAITKDCRPDMHEPDEQGISARVHGDHLDNAFGADIRGVAVAGGYQEFVIILKREQADGGAEEQHFNLATLIALARKAQV